MTKQQTNRWHYSITVKIFFDTDSTLKMELVTDKPVKSAFQTSNFFEYRQNVKNTFDVLRDLFC
jgi:hypothetical protein